MLYLLAQDTSTPDSFLPYLGWPVGLTVLAAVIFYFGWRVENRLMKAPWKWVAFVPLAYALYLGLTLVIAYQDPFYVAKVGEGKKMAFVHYGALLVPLLGLIGIVLFHFFNHKLNLQIDDD